MTGTVFGRQGQDSLIAAPNTDTYYEGSSNGRIPSTSNTGDYLKALLDSTDSWVDFGQYDNDGPDGQLALFAALHAARADVAFDDPIPPARQEGGRTRLALGAEGPAVVVPAVTVPAVTVHGSLRGTGRAPG